jgi:2-polyprenyl-3-methyl-5-hydroxy-6-metoxy-1,4-benzoquinol methylase
MEDSKKYYKNHRSEMIKFLPSTYMRVLDIGCGEGEFRKNLAFPNEYWGVELVSSVAKTASVHLDNVITGTYLTAEAQLPDNYFDLIICNDVIEHMTDHDEFLQRIKKKMAKNGVLVASIPNVRYLPNLINLLLRKDWKYTSEGILDKGHLRFFTQKSILNGMRSNGYVIEDMAGINPVKVTSSGIKKILLALLVNTLGRDTQYLQFGLRARNDC